MELSKKNEVILVLQGKLKGIIDAKTDLPKEMVDDVNEDLAGFIFLLESCKSLPDGMPSRLTCMLVALALQNSERFFMIYELLKGMLEKRND